MKKIGTGIRFRSVSLLTGSLAYQSPSRSGHSGQWTFVPH